MSIIRPAPAENRYPLSFYVGALISSAQETKVTHKILTFLKESFDLAASYSQGAWCSAFRGARDSVSVASNAMILTKIPFTFLSFFKACQNLPNADEDLGAEMSTVDKVLHTGSDVIGDSLATIGWFKTAFQGAKLATKYNNWSGVATCIHDGIELKESFLTIFETSFNLWTVKALTDREKVDFLELRRAHMIRVAKDVLHIALAVLKFYYVGFYALLVFGAANYSLLAIIEPYYKSIMTKTLEEKAKVKRA